MNGTIAIKNVGNNVRKGIVSFFEDTFKDKNQVIITDTNEIEAFPKTEEEAEKEYKNDEIYIMDVKTLLKITAEVDKNKENKRKAKMRNSLKQSKSKEKEIENRKSKTKLDKEEKIL